MSYKDVHIVLNMLFIPLGFFLVVSLFFPLMWLAVLACLAAQLLIKLRYWRCPNCKALLPWSPGELQRNSPYCCEKCGNLVK